MDHSHAFVVADQHVRRFEISLYDPGSMSGGEPARCLQEDHDDLACRARPCFEPAGEVDTMHVLLRDVDLVMICADVVHHDDVWMVDLGQRLRLAPKAPQDLLARGVAVDELECDLPI